MRIPLSVPFKTRTTAPDKDAKLKNAYIEVRNGQSIVRKRPIVQGGVSIGTGTAQGGIGLNIAGTDYIYTFNGDTGALDTLATAGTTYAAGTSYSIGDHVSAGFIDYWSLTDANVGNTPSSSPASWSTSYVPAVPPPIYATWGATNNFTLSGGDLIATLTAAGAGQVISNISVTSGKWYWEITASGIVAGELAVSANAGLGDTFEAMGMANGDVAGVALDADTKTLYLYKNGSLFATVSGVTSSPVFASVENFPPPFQATAGVVTANFGASAFTYSVPGGYNSGLYT